MLLLLNPDEYYFNVLESTIKKWLTSSPSLGTFAKSRGDFSSGFILKILDDFPMIENGAAEINSNLISFNKAGNKYKLFVKAAVTPYEYPQCKNLTHDEQNLTSNNLLNSINEVISCYLKSENTPLEKIFIVLVVFPCTHNDRDWEPLFTLINPFFNVLSELHDFRFINNVPGSIYFGELNKKSEELDLLISKIQLDFANYITNSDENIKEVKSLDNFKVDRQQIVEELRNEMLKNDSTFTFDELQELFEVNYKIELKSKYPSITNQQLEQIILKFRSKGSGAKRAHLLLTTVNERHRVHYRPNIKGNYDLYNLFYYVNENNHSKKKFVKAFDKGNTNISDMTKIYYERNRLKNEEPLFVTLGDLRNVNRNY